MRSLGSGFLIVFLVLSSLCLDLLELLELLSLVLRWRPVSQPMVTSISSSPGLDVVSSNHEQMETGWNVFGTFVHRVEACECSDFLFKGSWRV